MEAPEIIGPGTAIVKVKVEPIEISVGVQTAEEILREVESQVEAEVDLMMRSNEVLEDDGEKVSSVAKAMNREEKRLGIPNAAENDPDLSLVRVTKCYNKRRREPNVMRPERRGDQKYVAMRIENTRRAREWRDARRALDEKRVHAILHLTKEVQRLEKTINKFNRLNEELLSDLFALE